MTLLFELGAVAGALACASHMLWRMRHGKRTGCLSDAGGPASELADRQRVLAKRVETLSRSGRTPDRH
jgi:hypothetical protein